MKKIVKAKKKTNHIKKLWKKWKNRLNRFFTWLKLNW